MRNQCLLGQLSTSYAFLDCSFFLQELLKTLSVDAYVVVFSVNNPSTFQIAKDNLNKIRNELKINKIIILVANKIDLVRKRAVPANGITIFFYSKSLLLKKKKKMCLNCSWNYFFFNSTNILKGFAISPLDVTKTKLSIEEHQSFFFNISCFAHPNYNSFSIWNNVTDY